MKIKKIEHIGIACKDAKKAEDFFKNILGLRNVEKETLTDRKLIVSKISVGGSVLELLEPMEGEDVVSKFLSKRGEGIHHICFEVEDINEARNQLAKKGYKTVYESPRKGAGGKLVDFLNPKNTFGVLIELNQSHS